MKVVITVVGNDTVGILAKVSTACAAHKANIVDVSQTVMQELFCMIMLAETDEQCDIGNLRATLEAIGAENALQIHVMHEGLFNSMHRI